VGTGTGGGGRPRKRSRYPALPCPVPPFLPSLRPPFPPRQRCDAALYSERNRARYLDAIFSEELLGGLRGGRSQLSMSSSIPLRKAAVVTLTGLAKAWLWPADDGAGATGMSTGGAGGGTAPLPPLALSEALWAFLREQALPALLGTLAGTVTFGRQALDLRDAAAQVSGSGSEPPAPPPAVPQPQLLPPQALLTDVGGLVWTLAKAFPSPALPPPPHDGINGHGGGGGNGGPRAVSPLLAAVAAAFPAHLGEVAAGVGWPAPSVLALQQLVTQIDFPPAGQDPVPLGTFKEAFRKFVRAQSGGGGGPQGK